MDSSRLQVQKESVGQEGFRRAHRQEPPRRRIGDHAARQLRKLPGPSGVALFLALLSRRRPDPAGPTQSLRIHLQERKEVQHLQRGVQAAAAEEGQPLRVELPHVSRGDPQKSRRSQTGGGLPDGVAGTNRRPRLATAAAAEPVGSGSSLQPLSRGQRRGLLSKILRLVSRLQAEPPQNPAARQQQPVQRPRATLPGAHAGDLRGRGGEL